MPYVSVDLPLEAPLVDGVVGCNKQSFDWETEEDFLKENLQAMIVQYSTDALLWDVWCKVKAHSMVQLW